MSLRKSTCKVVPDKKRHRQSITLNVKLNVLQRYESGIRPVDIGRAMGLPSTTVRSIIKESDRIKEFGKQDTPLSSVRLSARRAFIVDMERLLLAWIENETMLGIRPTLHSIQEKARSLYEDLKKESDVPNAEPFRASRGWFERFKKRASLQNINIETCTSADTEGPSNVDMEITNTDKELVNPHCNEIENTQSSPETASITLNALVKAGGYTPQQVFNIDETGLFWKRMPANTNISVQELATSGYKVSKDRLSLLLGSNAAGDFKLKPLVVYHTETPQALKGYSKYKLSVIWRANTEAWVTQTIFEDWFTSYFCPAVKEYCSEHNVPNKALLIIDTAPGHPTALDDLSDTVKVIFLPANTNALLQPMNQGIITAFKAQYHRRIFTQALKVLESDCAMTLNEYWSNYSIMKGIDNISAAWNDITCSSINKAWTNLWSNCIQDYSEHEEPVETVYKHIVDVAKEIGMNDIESQDIEDLINSHSEELLNEEIRKMKEQRATYEGEDNTYEEHPTKTLSLECLEEALKHIEVAMGILEQNDPDRQRSSMVNYDIDNAIHCYRELCKEKKKARVQLSLNSFLNINIKTEPL